MGLTGILLVTDGTPGSDGAAKMAFRLAEQQKTALPLFHCYGLPSRSFRAEVEDMRSGMLEQSDESYQEWVREELRTTYAKQMEACTVPFDLVVSVGIPPSEIPREARKSRADIIIMGAFRNSSDSYAANIVGNTVRDVTQKSRCPVMIVPRSQQQDILKFSNVLFLYGLLTHLGGRISIFTGSFAAIRCQTQAGACR